MDLKQRDIESFYEAIAIVQEREPELVVKKGMSDWKFFGLYARIGIEMGIFPDYPKGTDIDDIHPAIVNQFGSDFNAAFTEATTIPKKSG